MKHKKGIILSIAMVALLLSVFFALTTITNNSKNAISVKKSFPKIISTVFDNEVYPEMFGAKGDGYTDDTKAIQKAFDSGKNVRFGAKTYRIEGTAVVNKPISIDGNQCTIVGSGSAERRVVFEIRSDYVKIKNFKGLFHDDSVYSGDNSVKGNNIILISIFSNHVDVDSIQTKGAFSTVFLTDRDHTIKHHIFIRNIVAEDGDMNIFMRYAENVVVKNVELSISKRCSELHPIYICSDVRNVTIEHVTIIGNGARDLISVHPSSQLPEEYNISNIQMTGIVLKGKYEYGMVFRHCKDILVSNLHMSFADDTSRFYGACSVFEAERASGIILQDLDCCFLGNLCRITNMSDISKDAIMVKDSRFDFSFTYRASHTMIRYAQNTTFENCLFTTKESSSVTLIEGNEKTKNVTISNSEYKPKQKGLLAKMEGGNVALFNCSLYNGEGFSDYAIEYESGECNVVRCRAYGIKKEFVNSHIPVNIENQYYSKLE